MKTKSKKKSGTGEWADSNVNIQFGCSNCCLYCFAQSMAPRHGSIAVEDWGCPVLRKDKLNKGYRKRKGRIMFPSAHDITPSNVEYCSATIQKLTAAGNEVLVVSKPRLNCIKRICNDLK